MADILIVDDEGKIREVLREYAEFEGHTTSEAADGLQAIELCKNHTFDIIIMDIMMPKIDGFTAVKEINKDKKIPILMLSARSEEYDKLFGFTLGIDDYVVKPFSPKEVMARISAILARIAKQHSPSDHLIFSGLTLDMLGRTVTIDDKKAILTPKEYDLLFYLARNCQIAKTRDQLLREVWGYDFFGDDRTVDTHIKTLRAALGAYRECIVTLRGVGYKFDPSCIDAGDQQ